MVQVLLRPPLVAVQRWKIQVAYDGSDFLGWQSLGDKSARTVHGSLLTALMKSHPQPPYSRAGTSACGLLAHRSGRSCRGASGACGPGVSQRLGCCHLETPLQSSLAQRVMDVEAVDQNFHARKSALKKCYRYDLLLADEATPFEARYVWPVGPVDLPLLRDVAEQWNGRRVDCRPFTVNWRSSCRDGTDVFDEDYYGPLQKQLSVRLDGGFPALRIYVEADAFLYRMVRVLVTALVAAGQHVVRPQELEVAEPTSLAMALKRVKGQCRIAPPNGLFLQRITYAEEEKTSTPIDLEHQGYGHV